MRKRGKKTKLVEPNTLRKCRN